MNKKALSLFLLILGCFAAQAVERRVLTPQEIAVYKKLVILHKDKSITLKNIDALMQELMQESDISNLNKLLIIKKDITKTLAKNTIFFIPLVAFAPLLIDAIANPKTDADRQFQLNVLKQYQMQETDEQLMAMIKSSEIWGTRISRGLALIFPICLCTKSYFLYKEISMIDKIIKEIAALKATN